MCARGSSTSPGLSATSCLAAKGWKAILKSFLQSKGLVVCARHAAKGLEPWRRITTKAPQPLYDLGMNFGARFAYDEAQCDGPWNCELNYNRFGHLGYGIKQAVAAVCKVLCGLQQSRHVPFPSLRHALPGCRDLSWYVFSMTPRPSGLPCLALAPPRHLRTSQDGQGATACRS